MTSLHMPALGSTTQRHIFIACFHRIFCDGATVTYLNYAGRVSLLLTVVNTT